MDASYLLMPSGVELSVNDLLGTVTITPTIPEGNVSHSQLGSLWAKHNLPLNEVPASRDFMSCFRDACRSVETTRRENATEEVKVEQVFRQNGTCMYQITRMKRDVAQGEITYQASMSASYDEITDTYMFDVKDDGTLQHLRRVIEERAHELQSTQPGRAVRGMIRRVLTHHCLAQPLRDRQGGIYFVPIGSQKTLEALDEFLDNLYGTRFGLLPVANTEKSRELVNDSLTRNCVQDCNELAAEVTNRLTGKRKPRVDFTASMFNQRAEILERIKQYEKLLHDRASVARASLESLDSQLQRLAGATMRQGTAETTNA